MEVSHLDHLVLTVCDIEKTVQFYQSVLGMKSVSFGENRVALTYGNQKINLYQLGDEFEPKAGYIFRRVALIYVLFLKHPSVEPKAICLTAVLK